MDKKEGSEKEGCCSGGGCRCRGGKLVKALVLLLLGGVIGYLAGAHCSGFKGGCPYTNMMSPHEVPATK